MRGVRMGFALSGCFAVFVALVSPAGAAIELGQTSTADSDIGYGFTMLQTQSPSNASYAAPSNGVITQWRFSADASPPMLKFQVGRFAGGTSYLIVGESALKGQEPNELNIHLTRIPVKEDDVIGLYVASAGRS